MTVREGTYELGPGDGRLLLRTSRSGLGRRAGHDLTIEASSWTAEAAVREPLEESSGKVVVVVDGLEVREGTGGVKPLSDKDRLDIADNLRKVLEARHHPEITFVSTAIDAEAGEIEGDLTIMGRTKPVRVRAEIDGDRLRGGLTVQQTRWGVKPFSAFFGALRLADEVEVEFDLRLSEAG
ncbi:YceI family protein [Actinomadura montaniterrae]|uniref:YceI family protein n=1 Tax=Actinomadura montaniterrae TaxID=1803903 RepID=A0A6L3VKB5_9ACTN|nr:YceI family protein [Actinomadura montaniterrae]KAB2368247.1 YceI family protein [Actinomadura montaniterrae]